MVKHELSVISNVDGRQVIAIDENYKRVFEGFVEKVTINEEDGAPHAVIEFEGWRDN